jgi:hypothetical protein
MCCTIPCVFYQCCIVQLQPSLSSRNANQLCQSLRIGSNTSAPRASSPNSNNQQDVLPSSLCVVSILCPVTTVLLIANPSCQSQRIGSNTSAPKASSPNSSNEHDVLHYSLCVLSIHIVALVLVCFINTLSSYNRPSHRGIQINCVNRFA